MAAASHRPVRIAPQDLVLPRRIAAAAQRMLANAILPPRGGNPGLTESRWRIN
jgi:hypothetical protein